MPSFLAENAQKLMHLNEGWAYRLYDDVACARFIKENYDLAIFKRYQSIHQDYGAARADFFRYLLIYKVGGVYLDIKSGCDIPFDTFLTAEDEYLLSHWRDPQWGYHAQFGVEAEFQQWHIMARPGHAFLAAVIDKISENISMEEDSFKELFQYSEARAFRTLQIVNCTLILLHGVVLLILSLSTIKYLK
jgi:mannosyltransferase OCH1-like enzyme